MYETMCGSLSAQIWQLMLQQTTKPWGTKQQAYRVSLDTITNNNTYKHTHTLSPKDNTTPLWEIKAQSQVKLVFLKSWGTDVELNLLLFNNVLNLQI